MKAIILSAGYATRLHPLTKNFPKALLKIKNRPIIEHITDKLASIKEIDEIIVVTNDRFYNLFDRWQKACKDRRIRVLNDRTKSQKDRLGAMGDLFFAIKRTNSDSDLLVLASDNLFNFKLDGLVAASKKIPQVSIGVFDIGTRRQAHKFGVVSIDKNNFIRRFVEKPKKPFSSLVAVGIYVVPKKAVYFIRNYLRLTRSPDTMGHFIEWLLKENKVKGYPLKGIWHDIGDIESYKKAKNEFD